MYRRKRELQQCSESFVHAYVHTNADILILIISYIRGCSFTLINNMHVNDVHSYLCACAPIRIQAKGLWTVGKIFGDWRKINTEYFDSGGFADQILEGISSKQQQQNAK